jgi:hypothetical protein
MNAAERLERLVHIRQYGTQKAAEETAAAIIAALPDQMPMYGIFPTGCSDDGDGDGGICFETFTGDGGVIVDINPDGTLDDGFWVADGKHGEVPLGSPRDAAAFLAETVGEPE